MIRHPNFLSNVLIYLSGLLSMVVGLAVINAHPSWTRDWRVVITIIGWLLLVGGIIIVLKFGSTFYGSPTTLLIVAIISLVLGGFLSFNGIGPKHEMLPESS